LKKLAPEDGRPPRVGEDERAEDADDRALATPIPAEQAEDFALADRE